MIILDTHALVWLDEGSDRLGEKSLSRIDQSLQSGELYVSAISFWEVAMLVKKGRLTIKMDVGLWRRNLLGNGLQEIALSGDVALYAALLEDFHGDPADRMIVATARHLNAMLCTADEKILAWKQELPCLDARR